MEHGEHAGCTAAGETNDGGAERMGQTGEPGRQQRMMPAQHESLDHPGRHLGRSDQRAGGDRLQRRGARGFENARQMRGHGPSDAPGGGKRDRQQHHRTIDRDLRSAASAVFTRAALDPRDRQQIERQADHELRRPPRRRQVSRQPRCSEARSAVSGQPTWRQAGHQGDAGDRLARGAAVDASE